MMSDESSSGSDERAVLCQLRVMLRDTETAMDQDNLLEAVGKLLESQKCHCLLYTSDAADE